MVLCSKCKKNMAVVFVTKMENGKEVSEGLCFQCAKELGIKPFDKMLSQFGINEDDFMNMNEQLTEMMEQGAMFGDNMMMMPMDEMPEEAEIRPEDIGIKQKNKKQKNQKKTPLESYGTNLNDKARLGEIDAVIGRNAEINRVIHILNRRTKNNPVLLGEPGVGKTAIAEGLALKIVKGEVPHKLLNAQIFLVDFAGMIAGTQFRGQFEQRLKAVVTDAIERGNVILVIDEIHNIVAAGDAKVDNAAYKAQFGEKAKMLPHDAVPEYVGHAVGGVCPFAVKDGVGVYLDVSLRRFQTVFPAAGSGNSAIELTMEELERYSGSTNWVDVCKGWRE